MNQLTRLVSSFVLRPWSLDFRYCVTLTRTNTSSCSRPCCATARRMYSPGSLKRAETAPHCAATGIEQAIVVTPGVGGGAGRRPLVVGVAGRDPASAAIVTLPGPRYLLHATLRPDCRGPDPSITASRFGASAFTCGARCAASLAFTDASVAVISGGAIFVPGSSSSTSRM